MLLYTSQMHHLVIENLVISNPESDLSEIDIPIFKPKQALIGHLTISLKVKHGNKVAGKEIG